MPGRPRKPTHLHKLEGTRTRTNRRDEPQPTGPLGDPPSCLPGDTAAAWREIADALAPGVAGNSDRIAVEIVARLLARLRSPEGVTAAEIACLHRGLASLGMTPAARSKVAPPVRDPKKAEADLWDAL
jgi:hypothetical protein